MHLCNIFLTTIVFLVCRCLDLPKSKFNVSLPVWGSKRLTQKHDDFHKSPFNQKQKEGPCIFPSLSGFFLLCIVLYCIVMWINVEDKMVSLAQKFHS